MNDGKDHKRMMKEEGKREKKDWHLRRRFSRPMLNIYYPYFEKLGRYSYPHFIQRRGN